MSQKTKTAYSYIRWSSAKQSDGDSYRRQREAAERWLKRNPEYRLDHTLTEETSSYRGRNLDPKYGSLGRFIEQVELEDSPIPPNSALIIERLDRFSRAGAMTAYNAIVRLTDAGVMVVIAEEGLEITSENNSELKIILPAILHLCLANDESKKRSERISEYWNGHRQKVEKGEAILSKQIPAWLYIGDKTNEIKVDLKKADIVKYIFKRTAEGIGQKLLCRELNDKFKHITNPKLNKKTGRATVPKWNTSYICSLLSNRQVLGELQPRKRSPKGKYIPHGKPIQDYFPRIVTDKDFYAARNAIEQKKKERYHERSNFVNLLSGLVFNGADKQIMHLVTTRVVRDGGSEYRQRRFQSHGKRDGLKGICPLTVDYFALEKLVLLSLSEISAEDLVGEFKPNLEKAKLLQSIAGCKNKLKELKKDLADPLNTKSTSLILDAIRKLDSQIERDEQEFSSLSEIHISKKQAQKNIEELHTLFSSLNNNVDLNSRLELRRLLPTIIKRIVVYPYKRQNRRVAARVVVALRAEGRYRRIILLEDKKNKRLPVITYYGVNKRPAFAICDVGLVAWESMDYDGSINYGKISDLLKGTCRISGGNVEPTVDKHYLLFSSVATFYEKQLLRASKCGVHFEDPFGPPQALIDKWKEDDTH